MNHLSPPAQIFYDMTIDHREPARLLEAMLEQQPDRGAEIRQYLADTYGFLDRGEQRWPEPESPEDARDLTMRRAIEGAARAVQ